MDYSRAQLSSCAGHADLTCRQQRSVYKQAFTFMLLAFHKPYDVLSQFTQEHPSHRTLAEFGFAPGVYPIGRLDRDSEGLLLLSDEARWTQRLLHPKHAHPRTYHAQVDGAVTEQALMPLRRGLQLKDYRALPCQAAALEPQPPYAERTPPIRYRKNIPTSWIELCLTEGKNRQVRHMTAAIGHPTLRLIRVAIGALKLSTLALQPGEWRELSLGEIDQVFET
jgi:23S rRNA pseudouridine2457 synthase